MKLYVMKEFRAVPIGKKNNLNYTTDTVFDVFPNRKEKNYHLRDIHGGNDLLIDKEELEFMVSIGVLKEVGNVRFFLELGL